MVKAAQASVLILLLACSAQAGWMGNGSPTPPPPPSPASARQDSTGGEVNASVTATGETLDDTTETLTQATLELLAVLPSLL